MTYSPYIRPVPNFPRSPLLLWNWAWRWWSQSRPNSGDLPLRPFLSGYSVWVPHPERSEGWDLNQPAPDEHHGLPTSNTGRGIKIAAADWTATPRVPTSWARLSASPSGPLKERRHLYAEVAPVVPIGRVITPHVFRRRHWGKTKPNTETQRHRVKAGQKPATKNRKPETRN